MTPPAWGLAFAAFAPLFAAWPGVASPYVLPKLFVLALGTAAAALAATRRPATAGPERDTGADLLAPLAACLAVSALASIFSQDLTASLLGEYSARTQGLLTLGACALIAALAQNASPAFARAALATGAAAGAALSAYAYLQLAGLDPVLNAVGSLPNGRAGSLVGSPVGLGVCLAMLLPAQLRLALDGEDAPRRRAGWICAGLSAGGLLVTWSRGAWLAAAAAAVCYLLWTGRLRRPKTGATLVACAVVAAVAFAAARSRPTRASDWGRVAVWRSALNIAAAHPLLGAGPDTVGLLLGRHKTEGFVRAYGESGGQAHAHNDFLQILATTGLFGLLAYVWLLLAAWRRLRQALREDSRHADAAAAGAGLVAVFLVAKFNPVPLDGLALAALLLGLLRPRGATPRGLPVLAAAAFLGAALTAGLLAADYYCLQGMRAQQSGDLTRARAAYAAAARLNPAEARYGFWLVGLIREQARAETDPARRLELGRDAVSAARVMERWNPRDARALHALGGSLAALALQGGPDGMAEAAAALERGTRADWSYRPVLETRLTVATLRGDTRAKTDTEVRLARLARLSAARLGN